MYRTISACACSLFSHFDSLSVTHVHFPFISSLQSYPSNVSIAEHQVSLDRERTERGSIESQLRDKVREVIDLQAKFDAQSVESNAR